MLCFGNNTLKVELPLTMKFTEARRHDSLNFLYTLDDFSHHILGLTPKNMCLDSAHDNLATYSLLEKWSINAFIDIKDGAVHPMEHRTTSPSINKGVLYAGPDIKCVLPEMIQSNGLANIYALSGTDMFHTALT